jgi:hypothetical protein
MADRASSPNSVVVVDVTTTIKCIGQLRKEISDTSPQTPERMAAVKLFMDEEARLMGLDWKTYSTQDAITTLAWNLRAKLPENIKKSWPTPSPSTLHIGSNYMKLWPMMSKSPGIYLEEVAKTTLYMHLHPHGLSFHFSLLSKLECQDESDWFDSQRSVWMVV